MNHVRVKTISIAAIFLWLLWQIAGIDHQEAAAGLLGAFGRAGKKVVSPVTGLFSGEERPKSEKGEAIRLEEAKSTTAPGQSQAVMGEVDLGPAQGPLPKKRPLPRPPAQYRTTIDRVVAVVNNEIITLSELEEQLYDKIVDLRRSYSGSERQKRIDDLKKEQLQLMVNAKLQINASKKFNINVPEKDIDAAIAEIKRENSLSDEAFNALLKKNDVGLDEYKSQIKEQILLRKVQNFAVRSRVQLNEKEIEEYYAKNIDKFKEPDEVKARQIFFLTEENSPPEEVNKVRNKAEAVLRMAKSGADFAELASKYSEDVSGEKGGDLGFFKRGEVLPAIEKAAFSLNEDEISELVRTKYGFHIIKVEKLRVSQEKPLAAVKDKIKEALFRKKAEEKLEQWLNELREDAFIEIMM